MVKNINFDEGRVVMDGGMTSSPRPSPQGEGS